MKRIRRNTKNRGTPDAGDLPLVKFPFKAMGSPCEIQLYGTSRSDARSAALMAIADVERLEQRYSPRAIAAIAFFPKSIASRPLEEVLRLMRRQRDCSIMPRPATSKAMACLTLPPASCDEPGIKSGVPPDEKHIQNLLDNIGWHKVRWKPPTSYSPQEWNWTLAGSSQGDAVDRLAALCWNKAFITGSSISGGQCQDHWAASDGSPWHIGIQHPRLKRRSRRSPCLGAQLPAVATMSGASPWMAFAMGQHPEPQNRLAGSAHGGCHGSRRLLRRLRKCFHYCYAERKRGSRMATDHGYRRYFWVDVQGNTGGSAVPVKFRGQTDALCITAIALCCLDYLGRGSPPVLNSPASSLPIMLFGFDAAVRDTHAGSQF